MNDVFPVCYHVSVGQSKFLTHFSVHSIPRVGDFLKILNYSFIVIEVEQDLDAYKGKDFEHGIPCNSVTAVLNYKIYSGDDYINIIEEFISSGKWTKTT